MPTTRTYIRHPRRGRLSAAAELDLWMGPAAHRPLSFDSDEQRRQLWFRHRDRLMQWFGSRGRRPMAWWRYEAGDLRYPGYDREQSTLWEAGLLAEAERTELLAFWREEFDRACAPGFSECKSQGSVLYGTTARRSRWRWADIPRSLLLAWLAERRRSARTIRELQAGELALDLADESRADD
jgi:hypothetical protein